MKSIIPAHFGNPSTELDFRREYARTGHPQSVIGLSTGLALALVAIALSFIFDDTGASEPAQSALLAIRSSIAVALGIGLVGLPPRSNAEPKDYLRWVIIPAAFSVLALILNYWVAARYAETPPPAPRIFLVSALALWLFCAFARPSSRLALAIALLSSIGAMIAGYIAERIEMLDTVAYLIIANFSAVSVTIQSEKRARSLYQRTLDLEASQRELRAKSDRAIRSRDFKSRVLTTVSHDLRQPLLGANLILSTQLTRADGPDVTKLHRVAEALRQVETGLEAILRAAAADEIDPDRSLAPVNLSELVVEALTEVEPIARELGIDIHWRNRLPQNLVVMTSHVAVRTALSNLLGNALKFQRRELNPWVLVRGFLSPTHPERAHLEVIDNGPGIDPMSATEIFTTGFRLPRDDQVPGFGIGLASVAEQMRELPHHDVILVPRYRKGARFRLTFPVASEWTRTSASG